MGDLGSIILKLAGFLNIDLLFHLFILCIHILYKTLAASTNKKNRLRYIGIQRLL